MKRFLLVILLSVLILPPTIAVAQTDEELLSFEGFDYEFPEVDPTEFGAAGDWYNMFGFIQAMNPTFLTSDTTLYQYTIEFYNLASVGFSDFLGFRFVTYSTGMVQIYEDTLSAPGTAAVHGINPPNATTPATFIDGTLILGGNVVDFGITLDLGAGTGSFNGNVNFNMGTQLGNIPVGPLKVFTFAGLTSGPITNVPEGYIHQVAGSIKLEQAVQVENSTWGRMKALYR